MFNNQEKDKIIEKGGNLEQQAKTIWFDLGYSYIKTDYFIIPSVVGNARKIRFNTGFSSDSLIYNLRVEFQGQQFFVGDLARRQSDQVVLNLDEDRYRTLEARVLLETTLGLLNSRVDETVNVVTGLPLDYLKYKEDLQWLLEKEKHEIRINGLLKRTKVQRAEILPQPMLAFFDLFLDENGKPRRKDFLNKTVGIIDIGFGTTDLSLIRNLEFIDKASKSKDIAMNNVYKLIAELIYDEFGVDKDIFEIEQEARSGILKVRGQEYDIKEIVDYASSVVANKLINWINTVWKDNDDIDFIFVAGGGAEALGDFLVLALGAEKVYEPQLAVLRGAKKVAKRIFG